MSADNGLLVKKNSEGSFDVYHLVAENQMEILMSEEKLRQDMEILHRIGDELIQAWKLNDDIEQEWSELN